MTSPELPPVFTVGAADAIRGASVDALLSSLAAAEQRALDLEAQLAIALGDQKKVRILRGEAPTRPRVGTRVVLAKRDTYLLQRHGASVGSAGIVVEHSRLSEDDRGVLVDWGQGGAVRANLDELSWTTAPLKTCRTVPGLLPRTKALRCVFCLTKVEGTGPRAIRYMDKHVSGIHLVTV
ncbi:hypothetical protein [Frigoribacterium sp. SL97]|uniref:hypothetical protein n=1 Tax=Frigoribacterium sp. SL97 TaxID=2994664 RepID=UPI00226F1FCA|nr:hypothetical protein [Frigoribacterium sp. SL97]WAC50332.1 hypothetical protein OVA02_10555 [Frigoribacterium sp. SL97]